jgi:hypothetical protein
MFMYDCNLMSKFANKFANYQVRNETSINMKDLRKEFENGEREREKERGPGFESGRSSKRESGIKGKGEGEKGSVFV